MPDRVDVRNKWVQFARNYDLTPTVAKVDWKIEWMNEENWMNEISALGTHLLILNEMKRVSN